MARVLVVDDEADMRLALQRVLTQAGHTVEQAAEGEAALARVRQGGLDAMLLDMRLPGMDGREILAKVRELDKGLPVVMVTGYGDAQAAAEVIRLGASRYLAKPFSNRELSDAVASVLRGASPAPARAKAAAGASVAERPAARTAAAAPSRAAAAAESAPWGKALLAAAAAALLAAGSWLALGRTERALSLDHSHPTALQWVGDTLWTADWMTQTVYEQRLTVAGLKTVRAVKLSGVNITGLAVAGDRLYVADSWRHVIQRRRLDARLSLVEETRSPGSSPAALFWDGRYLWSGDSASGRIYQHDADRGLEVLASYKSPGRAPVALFRDQDFFWSVDADTRMLYQHRLDNQLRVIARYELPALDRGSQALSCFTWRDGALWLGRDGSPVLLKTSLSRFKKIGS